MLRHALALGVLLLPASAAANTDVVLLLGNGAFSGRSFAELAAFERALGGARIAVAHGEDGAIVFDQPLGDGNLAVALKSAEARHSALAFTGWSRLSVDLLDRTLDAMTWAPGAARRIVLVDGGHALIGGGRTTIEEVVFRAEREGVVIHALEVVQSSFFLVYSNDSVLRAAARDANRFLDTPHATLGRVPSNARHATLQSGGSYHLALTSGRRRGAPPLRPLSTVVDVDALFGPRTKDGEDALNALADGRRRSFEYTDEELPPKLAGVDMEPLLDAVWDYVDARRLLMAYDAEIERLADPKKEARRVGEDLARAVLAPRRLPPSRR